MGQLTGDDVSLRKALSLHAVIDGVSVIATAWDGTIGFWNKGAEAIYGWATHEVLGENISDVTPASHAAGQAAEIMARLREGALWEGEFSVRHRNGIEFPAFVVDTPLPVGETDDCAIVGVSGALDQRSNVLGHNTVLLRSLEQHLKSRLDLAAAAVTTGTGAYYRCYLIDRSDHFRSVKAGHFSSHARALAFARAELNLIRRRHDLVAVEVWSGGRMVGRVEADAYHQCD